MRESARHEIEAARLAILGRLKDDLPGPGEVTVDALRAPLSDSVVFLCRRSNRIGFILLTVELVAPGGNLAYRALDELASTQMDALETPRPAAPTPTRELVGARPTSRAR